MTHPQSTRCPHCHTAFRVTPEQLAAARGSVRCGSCLQVFNARDYLLTDEPAKAAPPRNKAVSAPSVPSAQPAEADRSRPAPEKTSPGPVTHSERTAPAPPEDARRFAEDDQDMLFEPDDAGETDALILEAEEDDFIFQDDDAVSQLNSGHQTTDYDDDHPEPEPDELEFSDSFMTLDSAAPKSPEADDRKQAHDRSAQASADDSWALDMLADLEREEQRALPASHLDMSLQDEPEAEEQFPDYDPALFNTRKPARTPAALEPERSNLEAAFSVHELDDLAEHKTTANRSRLWLGLAATALVVLGVGQLLWWERATLSQQPALQPLYNFACQGADCAFLDTGPSASNLRSLSSVLRPLPDGRMRLDAVFINRSDRPAPFPLLVLALENAQGEIVADGLFAPDDYVGGELQPTDLVPPGRPISISLNINRPVDDLSNFRLSFHY